MITRSKQFDLGLDRTRIKDQRDASRQEATVDVLLQRMFDDRPGHRWELQVLADEVGMGKTFVGLGTAYSVLEAMRNGKTDDNLRGCYQKVLIITPQNSALYAKWNREVGEFVKRCVKEEYRKQAGSWYAAAPVDRVDDLVYELRRRGAGPQVIVASMSIFGGGRLRNYEVKRRHLLGVLFRYWGVRFKGEQRERLLKGNDEWPQDPSDINDFTDTELRKLLFSEDELLVALRQLDSNDGCVEKLLETCREIATPYVRRRDVLFRDERVEAQLVGVYRQLMGYMINRALPLVIVDEAHNWKNGPTLGSNGYKGFVELLGNRVRRALLLTATPFQLRPAEMLEILRVGEHLNACPTEAESHLRRDRLTHHCEYVIRPVLNKAADSSRRFARSWSRLPPVVKPEMIESAWRSPGLVEARLNMQAAVKGRGQYLQMN